MHLPVAEHFNNPEYYTQKLPERLAHSRLWQLVYGEFRAPMLVAVLRRKMQTFGWDADFSLDEAHEATRLLQVWSRISDNRKAEWPSMHAVVERFTEALANTLFEHEHGDVMHAWADTKWIDDNAVWDQLVIQPYHAL